MGKEWEDQQHKNAVTEGHSPAKCDVTVKFSNVTKSGHFSWASSHATVPDLACARFSLYNSAVQDNQNQLLWHIQSNKNYCTKFIMCNYNKHTNHFY